MRLFTCVDVESKLSKWLWKFNNNTIVRCDLVNLQSLPPLSAKIKRNYLNLHPHQTPGFKQKQQQQQQNQNGEQEIELQQGEKKQDDADNNSNNDNKNEKKKVKVEKSFVLVLMNFIIYFCFLRINCLN